MNRRTFVLSAAISAALFFTGCKSDPEPVPTATGDAAAAKCSCPEGQCACAECKAGDMANCSCAPAGDAAGTGEAGSGQ